MAAGAAAGVAVPGLEDRAALRDLVDRYALAADTGDRAALVALFTAQATVVAFQRGTDERLRHLHGHEEIATLLDGLTPFEQTQHLMVGHHVSMTGQDSATGRVDGMAHHLIDRGNGTEDLVMHLRYDDVYVRADGGWRFERRSLTIRWASWLPVEQEPLAV
ncbi:MAG: hypothetical protein JWQ20_3019 [Conexibacter sp.]|jgi:uncharacterized protein (TIGR02246 family)|nr:hypothetical protein [Conexibacter sp.]